MSLPRYPKYKDSGVAWLGEVPGHWEVTKTKHVLEFTTGWTPPTGDSASFEGDNLWANISDLGPRWIHDTSKRVSDLAVTTARIGKSPKNSLLFSFKLSIGQVSFAAQDMYTNEAIATFLPSPKVDLGFAYYAFPLFLVQNASVNIYGAKLLNQELIKAASFAMPPPREQTQLAAFLDRETVKIDELVAEQRRLMALLKEKRQAVISHAVTRGLNPDAPLKPSGIEWLGDVPAHWVAPALNLRYSMDLGKMLDAARITGDHPVAYLRNVDVQWDVINYEELPEMDIQESEYPRYVVQQGDLLVCEGGEVGRAAMVKDVAGVYGFQKALHRLRPRTSSECTRFLFYTFVWAAATGVFNAGGTSTIAHLTGEQLRRYRFPNPPVAEQADIAEFLDAETTKLDTLTTEAQRAIDLLQERRTALISAAVTGQIDVRGMVAA